MYVRLNVKEESRICSVSVLISLGIKVDIKVWFFSIDIGNILWLETSFMMVIYKQNSICLLEFSDKFQMLTNFDWFTFLSEREEWRGNPLIHIEFFEEFMDTRSQLESNPVDKDWVDNLRIVIVSFEFDSIFRDLSKYGDDFFLI